MSDTEKLLRIIAEQLNGKLYYVTVSDNNTEHKKIVIEYGHGKKSSQYND